MRIYNIGTIAVNLCIYFLEHALFLKQSGSLKFCLGSLVISYFSPASGPKMRIFYHTFA